MYSKTQSPTAVSEFLDLSAVSPYFLTLSLMTIWLWREFLKYSTPLFQLTWKGVRCLFNASLCADDLFTAMQKSGLEQGIKQAWIGVFTVDHPPFYRVCSVMQAVSDPWGTIFYTDFSCLCRDIFRLSGNKVFATACSLFWLSCWCIRLMEGGWKALLSYSVMLHCRTDCFTYIQSSTF